MHNQIVLSYLMISNPKNELTDIQFIEIGELFCSDSGVIAIFAI